MLHLTAILLATWTVSPSPQQPRAVASSASRREVLQYACGAASAAALVGSPLPAFAAKDRKVLNEQVVQILRVKESAAQETRLIKTGLFKDKQRSGIKRAVTFMLDNSNLRDRFVTASAYVEQSQQQTAQSYAGTAVEGLVQILEYFPQDLVVNKLSSEQNEFVLKGLSSVSSNIDNFLSLMPEGVVEAATAQILEENALNEKEYQSEDGDNNVINPITLKDIK